MFDLTFLVNFINKAINMIVEQAFGSITGIEDQLMNLPDEEDVGVKITQEQYDREIDDMRGKIESIETTVQSIEQVRTAVSSLVVAFTIIKNVSKIIMLTSKLSVAAVPGGIAVLAAQELKDLGQKMMEQSGSAIAALKNKTKDIGTETKNIDDKVKNMLDELNDLV